MSSSTISKNSQLYSSYDNRTVINSQLYPLLYNADVWVDASDTSTFSLTGASNYKSLSGNWNDKSKNANHLVPTGGAPFYDEATCGMVLKSNTSFTGPYFIPTNDVSANINNECFMVAMSFYGTGVTGSGGSQYILGYITGLGSTQRTLRINAGGLASYRGGTTLIIGSTIQEGQRVVITFYNNNGLLQHFINGKLDRSFSGSGFTNQNGGTSYFGPNGGNVSLRASVHEIVHFSSAISSNQKQLLEYYLINKWKVPTTIFSNPTTVSGCRLWLDASDRSTISLSGTSVTQWNDKSGNSNNATGITSYLPTYTSGTPQINFSGTQGMRTPYVPNSSGTTEHGFIVLKPSSSAQYFLDSSDTTNGRNLRLYPNIYFYWAVGKGGAHLLPAGNGGIMYSTPSVGKFMLYSWFITGGISGSICQSANKTQDAPTATGQDFASGTYTQIGARGTTPGSGLVGSIQEVIIYNTDIGPANREIISNYLMNKWGITCLTGSVVNVYNAFQKLPPALRYFTPNDIDNCVLWLDAADKSTLFTDQYGTILSTVDGDKIGMWKDKSPSINNPLQSNLTLQPTVAYNVLNKNSVINFNGNTYLNVLTTSLPTGTGINASIFVVSKSTNANNAVLIKWGANPLNTFNDTIYIGYEANSSDLFLRADTNPTFGTLVDNVNVLNTYIILSSILLTNPQITNAWRNGVMFGDIAQATSTSITTGIGYIGQALQGEIAEIIVYNRKIGDGEREQIEGYLADKWGLRPNLPSTHTLKNITPQITPFNPKTISSCTFWYDMSDPSTITYSSGSTVNVTAVQDKSGNGIDLVRDVYTAGREITTANKLNGLTTLTYPGDPAPNNACLTYLRSSVPVPMTSNANYCFFVMRFNPYVLEGTTTARSWPIIFPMSIGVSNAMQGGMYKTGTNWYLNYNVSFVGTAANGTPVVSNRANGPAVGTPLIGMFGKTAAAQYVFSYNGTYETKAGGNYAIVGGQPMSVGNFYQGQELCEMIMFQGKVLTLGEIQEVEGYLAWKWGLVGNLPATHAYKKYSP